MRHTCSEDHDRPRVVVIGCGNPDRRDDGAGLEVVRRAADLGVEVRCCTSDLLQLLDLWQGFDHAVIVDACLRVDEIAGSRLLAHTLDLNQVIELARTLGRVPPLVTVVTIEGRDFGYGRGLSAAAANEIPTCLDRVLAAIRRADEPLRTTGPF